MSMHSGSSPFPRPGTDLGALDLNVSPEANDRYWGGAGIDHPLRHAGWLFPPMAVNLSILLIQQTVPDGVLHTWGRVRCHAAARAGCALTITGRVQDRFEKRERDYFVVASQIAADDGTLLWSSELELAASRRRPGAGGQGGPERPRAYEPDPAASVVARRLTLGADLLRAYSRAGNFHSDDASARSMGLPGMTAMGMQTLGPAIGVLADAWGPDLLSRGETEVRFFGLVLEDDTVEVEIRRAGDAATVGVRNVTKDLHTAAGRIALV